MTTSSTDSLPHSSVHAEESVAAPYTGRFAPSPTGPLHFGSLIAALASYLDAKSNSGKWLLRIEDLDPPREPAGAAITILEQLNALGFSWDGEPLYQSSRINAYENALNTLIASDLCFHCQCTRPRIRSLGSIYDGHCRENRITADSDLACLKTYAIRVQTCNKTIEFQDLIQGHYQQNIQQQVGDFVIKRKDGLFAYQLAVVVDDHFQAVNNVVRGYDLIDSTPRQIYLQQLLGLATPQYAHFPVAANLSGEKLSKQQFADEVDVNKGPDRLLRAMAFLGLHADQELKIESPSTILQWGIDNWDIQNIPKLANICGSW